MKPATQTALGVVSCCIIVLLSVSGRKIDTTRWCWKEEEVRRLLDENEAQAILVQSFYGCRDKLIWHYTKHGRYSVKSGYELAQSMERNGELGRRGDGESSTEGVRDKVWNDIVQIKIVLIHSFDTSGVR